MSRPRGKCARSVWWRSRREISSQFVLLQSLKEEACLHCGIVEAGVTERCPGVRDQVRSDRQRPIRRRSLRGRLRVPPRSREGRRCGRRRQRAFDPQARIGPRAPSLRSMISISVSKAVNARRAASLSASVVGMISPASTHARNHGRVCVGKGGRPCSASGWG